MNGHDKREWRIHAFWGTLPQWASAAAALGILYITITGLKAAKPIFENAALREANAQLQLKTSKSRALLKQIQEAIANQTASSWRYACEHYAAKAQAAASPNFILSSVKSGEIDELKKSLPVFGLRTGAELMRSPAIRDDLDILSAAERTRFEQMIESFIRDNGAVMSASIQVGPTDASQSPTAETDRAKQARQAFDQAMQKFQAACTAAATVPAAATAAPAAAAATPP